MKCSKCGNGGIWRGPTYEYLGEMVTGERIGESLVFKCANCGYKRRESTLDAPPLTFPPPPPAPPAWSDPNTEIIDGPRWLKRLADRFFLRHTDISNWRTPR